jgi:hypothetical protein
MRLASIAILLGVALLSGCASNPTFPLSRPSPTEQTELIVYRESSFIASGVAVTVGVDGKAFANVSNGDKVRVLLPTGEREIYVQARSATPSKVKLRLTPAATVCLRTSSSAGTLAKVIIPITLIVTGYHFYLDEVPCPERAELDKYKDTPVAYQ